MSVYVENHGGGLSKTKSVVINGGSGRILVDKIDKENETNTGNLKTLCTTYYPCYLKNEAFLCVCVGD